MFRDTLKLLEETLDNTFVAPVNIEIIEPFMHTVSYQGVVDKVSAFYTKFLAQPWQTMFEKDVIQYPRFTKLIIADLMKKYTSISSRLKEDYHSIKDDISLVSVYTTGNVTVRGMLIPDTFLTYEIHATDDYKESIARAQRTPTLTTASPQGKKREQIQEKLVEEEIEKMVEGDEDEESYASTFADAMFNDDVDDTDDEQKDDNAEKTGDAEEKDNDDHTDHTLVEPQATGSMETRNEQMQTPILIEVKMESFMNGRPILPTMKRL
ncbi:hypothetical protein Tco_1269603 [Tanacetum coccineum]